MKEIQKQLIQIIQRKNFGYSLNKGSIINNIRMRIINDFHKKSKLPEDNYEYLKQFFNVKESLKIMEVITLRMSLFFHNLRKKYFPNLNDKVLNDIILRIWAKKWKTSRKPPFQLYEENLRIGGSNGKKFQSYTNKYNLSKFTFNKIRNTFKTKHQSQNNTKSGIRSCFDIHKRDNSTQKKNSNQLLISLPTYQQCAKRCSSFNSANKDNSLNSQGQRKDNMNIFDKYLLNVKFHLFKKKMTPRPSYTNKAHNQMKEKSNNISNKGMKQGHHQFKIRVYDLPFEQQIRPSSRMDNYPRSQKEKERNGNNNNTKNTFKWEGKYQLPKLKTSLNSKPRNISAASKLSNLFIINSIMTNDKY